MLYLDRVIKRNKLGQFIKGSGKKSSNYRWNGGKTTDGYGYIKILKHGHPMSDSKGYVYLHRYLMSKKVNRIFESSEIVHHINGKITDNREKNLKLISEYSHKSGHGKIHNNLPKNRKSYKKICISCKKKFLGGNRAKWCNICHPSLISL